MYNVIRDVPHHECGFIHIYGTGILVRHMLCVTPFQLAKQSLIRLQVVSLSHVVNILFNYHFKSYKYICPVIWLENSIGLGPEVVGTVVSDPQQLLQPSNSFSLAYFYCCCCLLMIS
jgi:hypothetical protein